MPLTRYQIRNEYGLADPELYRGADKDDPEALLEGVAMAGLVGILRQLGDLAEFAAEMFHDLHEEVVATAARGHGLMVRVQQLEAEFPSIEKVFLSRTDHSPFFSNTGMEWHPNLQMQQNLITRGDLPRCVMDSYEECRGPPRLFLLDKFDIAGAGACLKRYTDPSFFRLETASLETSAAKMQREKKSRKVKKKGSRWRNGGTPDITPTSHAKLHQLFLEERVESGRTDPARRVKLKTRNLIGSPLNSKSGRSYMDKFLQIPSPEHKIVSDKSALDPLLLTWSTDNSVDSGIEITEIGMANAVENSCQGTETEASSPNEQEVVPKPPLHVLDKDIIDRDIQTVPEPFAENEADGIPSVLVMEKELAADRKGRTGGLLDGSRSEDLTSEVENYVDALATMESEGETDNEGRPSNESGFLNVGKHETDSDLNEEQMEIPPDFSDSHSVDNTSASDGGGCSSFKKERSSFSCSDTVSIPSENEPSDDEEAAELLLSTGTSESELVDSSSNNLPVDKNVPESYFHDCQPVSGKNADKDSISDFEEVSCNSRYTSSSPKPMPWDNGAHSPLVQLVAPELVETSLACVKLGPGKLGTEENETHVADCGHPFDVHAEDILDGRDQSFSSNALENLTKVPDASPEEKGCNAAVNNVVETNYADDSLSKNMANEGVVSVPSAGTPVEEQFPTSARSETEMSNPVAKVHSENICTMDTEAGNILAPTEVPGVGNEIPVAELTRENSSPIGTDTDETIPDIHEVNRERRTSLSTDADERILPSEVSSEKLVADTSLYSGLEGNQFLDTSHDQPQEKPDMALIEGVHSEQKTNLETLCGDVDDDEDSGLSSKEEILCKEIEVEGYAIPLRCPLNGRDDERLGNQIGLDSVATGRVYKEEDVVAVSNVDAASVGDDVKIVACLFSNSIPSPSRRLEDTQESLSIASKLHHDELESIDTLSLESHLESEAEKQMELLEVVSAHLDSVPSKTVSYLPSLNKPHEDRLAVDDAPVNLASSEKIDLEPEKKYLLQSGDTVAVSTCYLPEHETPTGQSTEVQGPQAGHLQADVAGLQPANSKSEILRYLDYEDQGRYTDASTESSPEGSLCQRSFPELLSPSADLKLNTSQQAFYLDSAPLNFGFLPEAAQTNMEEMPPLPPLPPMQWRIGKVQPAVPSSQRASAENSWAPFPPVSDFAADRNGQFMFSVSHKETMQPQNLSLPLASVEEGKTEQFAGNVGHPSPLPSHFPAVVTDVSGQYKGIPMEGTQSLNPFLTLPVVSNQPLEQGFLPPEENIVQSTTIPSLPESTAQSSEDLQAQPLIQFADKGFEGETFDHISQNSGECNHSHRTSLMLPQCTIAEEQHQLVQPGAGGEKAQASTSSSQKVLSSSVGDANALWPVSAFALAPTFDAGKANEVPTVKLPRPRSPLVDAVAAHDRSSLRKVSELIRPPIEPKAEEKDSWLEQIRKKSFNLKPAMAARPGIQAGPKTNLKVAAILEKANTIRQAMAGSDEDGDSDSWSDS